MKHYLFNKKIMATINFKIRSNKNPSKIYCRFVNGRTNNISIPLNIFIDPKNWDSKQQKIKNIIGANNSEDINRSLSLLKVAIFDAHNLSYSNGDIIDKNWLEATINSFFNRPKQEGKGKITKHTIYYTDFAYWWLENKSSSWLVNSNSYMSKREIAKHKSFLGMVEDHQDRNKLRLKDITNIEISEFVKHLSNNHYASVTIKRAISRFKFFLFRAEELGLTINPSFKQRVFSPKTEPVKKPYLSTQEIDRIYNYDFSDNETLDSVRDNLILACWSGLRISDFNSLNIDNFIDDYIEVTTKKTKTPVVIPVHYMVKRILIKRNGKLPSKISDSKFNRHVKEVCRTVGLKEKIKGSLYNKDKKRSIVDLYPKWKLISSHVGRRSFCTNLIGKIDDHTIMAIGGWKTKSVMYDYVKKSGREHANKLKEFWNENIQ